MQYVAVGFLQLSLSLSTNYMLSGFAPLENGYSEYPSLTTTIYHIETHYATLWTWTLSNVFLYGWFWVPVIRAKYTVLIPCYSHYHLRVVLRDTLRLVYSSNTDYFAVRLFICWQSVPYRNTLTHNHGRSLPAGYDLLNVFLYGIRVRESNPFSTYDDLSTRTPFATGWTLYHIKTH